MSSTPCRRQLSENEKSVFEKINQKNLEEVKVLLNQKDVRINCVDNDGMSFLCQAAFKGCYEICKLLINNGANVNDTQHVHGYTALMFAGIGGHLKVVDLLLEAGVDVNHLNSVGRTAAQMAAFVGQHEVVSIINNFVSKEDILYFTQTRGLENSPKLKLSLADPLWAYLRMTNIHPVRLVLELEKFPQLIDKIKEITKVLDLMMEREMKKKDANEMLALKFKYVCFFLDYFDKNLSALENKASPNMDKKERVRKCSELLCKNWLKGRESDGFPINLECFLRECVKQFPYPNSMVFIEIVKTLSSVKIGDEPSALSLLSRGISGQKGYGEDVSSCPACSEPKPSKKCSQCKMTLYCDQRCQRLHWPTHKKLCTKLKDHNKNIEETIAAESVENSSQYSSDQKASSRDEKSSNEDLRMDALTLT